MAALTSDLALIRKGVQNMECNEYPVAASTKIYAGAAVGDNGSGYARPLEAGDPFLGFAKAQCDNSSGAAGDLNVEVETGMQLKVAVTGIAITSAGAKVYMSDDNTFTLTSTDNSLVGTVREFVSTGVGLVKILDPGQAANL